MSNFKNNLLMDFYELTMANNYFVNGMKDEIVYFEMFFRKVPEGGGFAIYAGLEQLLDYIKELSFDEEDIAFLKKYNLFDEGFLDYLRNFKFKGDIWSVKEGTPIFPYEPIIIVKGNVIDAQIIETMVLLTINHQSLIATKANRIVRAANGKAVLEFGSRRAHSYDAAVYGARAAFIGGCAGTACTVADKLFDVPAGGTMAHSYVQMFDSELEAFRTYAKTYPDNCVLLVDTYNVLKCGLENAIKVFKEEVVPRGYRPKGIRIDSGDITFLSKEARKRLDEEGFTDCKIIASNSLDENIITSLIAQGAKVDTFGVGENLITSKNESVFGGVYKLVGREQDGKIVPKIKLSENVGKITNPSFKKLYRFFDKDTKTVLADVIALHDECVDCEQPYNIFDPVHTWKEKTLENYDVEQLLIKVVEDGHVTYQSPSVKEIKAYASQEIGRLREGMKRLQYPDKYYVDLSKGLWELKNELIQKRSK